MMRWKIIGRPHKMFCAAQGTTDHLALCVLDKSHMSIELPMHLIT